MSRCSRPGRAVWLLTSRPWALERRTRPPALLNGEVVIGRVGVGGGLGGSGRSGQERLVAVVTVDGFEVKIVDVPPAAGVALFVLGFVGEAHAAAHVDGDVIDIVLGLHQLRGGPVGAVHLPLAFEDGAGTGFRWPNANLFTGAHQPPVSVAVLRIIKALAGEGKGVVV